jgi:hypothetical protein
VQQVLAVSAALAQHVDGVESVSPLSSARTV